MKKPKYEWICEKCNQVVYVPYFHSVEAEPISPGAPTSHICGSVIEKKSNARVISFDALKRLQFTNSPKLPKTIKLNNEIKEWVGIGWVESNKKNYEAIII
jgi:hypothetical protein